MSLHKQTLPVNIYRKVMSCFVSDNETIIITVWRNSDKRKRWVSMLCVVEKMRQLRLAAPFWISSEREKTLLKASALSYLFPGRSLLSLFKELKQQRRLWLEWLPQNQVGHLMFITQRYTLYHAILHILICEFIGHENFQKSGEIRVGDLCKEKSCIH